MNRRKKLMVIATAVICIVMVCAAVWAITGLLYQTTRVNWNMYGTLITTDGEIGDTVEFTVKGKVKDYKDEADRIMLDIDFPDTFRYSEYSYAANSISRSDQLMDIPYFLWEGYSKTFMDSRYGLSLDEEYMIFQWKDEPYLLVASTDPDADPQEIYEYFHPFAVIFPARD